MNNVNVSRFDQESQAWDANPRRVKLSQDIARSILRYVPLSSEMDILDYGCGTGLVSLQVRPKVHSVTGLDNSKGMLEVFRKKIDQQYDLASCKGYRRFNG